jgi:outer membrane protein assembly factor BamB
VVGPATDIFALGGTVVFAVTGHGPFGVAPAATLMYRTVYAAPEIDDVPPGLRKVLLSCLEKAPEDRPTATELMAGFAVAVADQGGQTSPEMPGDASTVTALTALPKPAEAAEPAEPAAPAEAAEPAEPAESTNPGGMARRRLLIGGSAAAVAVAMTATWLDNGSDGGRSDQSVGTPGRTASASSKQVPPPAPAVGNQGWILATDEASRQVVAVDIATKKEVWRSQVTLGDGRYLTVSAGLVFASGKGQVEVFDLRTGAYRGPIGAPHITGVTGGIITARDGYVYVSCNTANQLIGFSGLEPKAPGPGGWTGQLRLLDSGTPNVDYGHDCLTVIQPRPDVVTAVSKTRNAIIYSNGYPAEGHPRISEQFPAPPISTAYSANGPGLLVAAVGDTIVATRWDTAQQVKTISCGSPVFGIAANGLDAFVYATQQNGFCAYRVDTGERLWFIPPGDGGPGHAVPYDDVVTDRVFFSSADEVFALDRRTGSILWVSKYSNTPRQPNSSPVLFSNVVYIAAGSGIRGFDAGTGEEVFAAATTTTFNMRPVICGSDGLLASVATQG